MDNPIFVRFSRAHGPIVTFLPIVEYVRDFYGPGPFGADVPDGVSSARVARFTGIDPRRIATMRADNAISIITADRICCRMKVNPATVYGPAWYDIPIHVPHLVPAGQRGRTKGAREELARLKRECEQQGLPIIEVGA